MIQRVDFMTVRRETRGEKELDILLERKNKLEDRLQALTTREEIFKAAVKSQSSKTPRKTKNNPDPMSSIRQGTDFAIAQLEAVNTARRKTMLEMRHIDARITEARKGDRGTEMVARISATPNNARIRIRYALAGQTWTPRYDIRINGNGKAALTLYGQVPRPFGGLSAEGIAGNSRQQRQRQFIPGYGRGLSPSWLNSFFRWRKSSLETALQLRFHSF